MSKKRDIYNEMDSEENDTYGEGYPSYYEEEDVGEPENVDNSSEQARGGYMDDEAEEDPYYDDERGGSEAYEPYFDPYDPRFQQYLLRNGYINYRGGREDNYDDYDFSPPSSSSSSSSSESSDSSSEGSSSDSSSEERVTKRKPKRTFRAKKKTTRPKKNTKKTTRKRKSK